MIGRSLALVGADPMLDTDSWWSRVLAIAAAKALAIFVIGLVATMFMVWFERKIVAGMQNRVGPNKAGPFGILQTLADGMKLMFKEGFWPDKADKGVFLVAPFLSFVPAFLIWSVIPLGGDFTDSHDGTVTWLGKVTRVQLIDPPIGILVVLALSGIAVYGVMLAGWSSGSKYPLLGAVRATAQMISYELSMGLSLVGVMILAGSMNFVTIVDYQAGAFWHWNFIPQLVGFVIFFIASIAELNRTPFDLPEAEQELVAGYMNEYTGMRWGIFMFSEYVNMIVMSAIMATLFFGGWRAPFESWNVIPGFLWLIAKMMGFIILYMWVRWSVPRYRYNQLMSLGWKILFPLALANLAVTALVVTVK